MKSIKQVLKTISSILFLGMVVQLADAQTVEHRTTTTTVSEFSKRLEEYAKNNPDKTHKGVIDVTCAPYNAKGDGITDDTQAIQDAIDDAYPNSFMVYLPGGKTFLVSKQLKLIAPLETRQYGHQLVGAENGIKPIICLKDGSTIDNNILVFFQLNSPTKGKAPASHYGFTFRNINIDLGNNPEAIGIMAAGAQQCVLEDTKIYGKAFKAGIKDLPGSGGGCVNIHIVGGDIGIDQNQHRANPTIEGLVLEEQKEYGIKLQNTRGPLVLAGFKITAPQNPSAKYRAIYLNNTYGDIKESGALHHAIADMCLTDGSIEVPGEGGIAISNGSQDVTLVNVYIKADKLIESGVTTAPYSHLAGDKNKWKKISKYMFTSKLDKGSVVIGGKELNDRTNNYVLSEKLINEAPNEDIYSKHSYSGIPDFNDPNIVDITEYGATRANKNADDNDAIAIQKALDDVSDPKSKNYGKTVLIPRGNFDLEQPLFVKKGTKLIGTAKSSSKLVAKTAWDYKDGAIINTADDAEGNIILSDFTIMGHPRMCYLRVQSANTIVRDIVTEDKRRYGWPQADNWKKNKKKGAAYIEFCKNAGGKVYHISADHIALDDRYRSNVPVSGYHIVDVNNTTNPLTFYQLSVEHHPHSPSIMIKNAKNTTIFGMKYEGPAEHLNIVDSENIQVIGGSGNYYMDREYDRAIVVISNSKDIVLRNLTRKSKSGKLFNRTVTDITKYWIMDSETKVTGDYSVLWYENGVLDRPNR
ncbi:glycosyl hydrolase family 28-related protein [Carboxylicivirga marina]|uniref:glycosyl hydrolase family 28-related protein n=1 Tax=Carboxylicivirga marina TaxID=2800988 RepID=UPI00259930CA|nr:glycosyl hydrolase family 28-related protein [uncultured Carboxylicivirga sp.]